jgi:hypothetical protein
VGSRRPRHCNQNGVFEIVAAMTDSGKSSPLVAIALLAAMLSGCASSGGTSDETVGRVLFAPGGFALYSCTDLADRATANLARQHELERLMTKAGVDSGGRLVSSVAYRPEYLERRGEMVELRRVAAEKGCKFVPGVDNPGARVSDSAVR